MKVDEKVKKRLMDLVSMGEKVLSTKYSLSDGNILVIGDDRVDSKLASQWAVSSMNMLKQVFGDGSDYYRSFNALYQEGLTYSPSEKCVGILSGALDDYNNGYIFNTESAITSDVFDEFLEQAEHLLLIKYKGPAAVIAGCVLEDGLRKMCSRSNILVGEMPKIDSMNAELSKSGVYNKMIQKRITALADIRNKAAHGQWDDFNDDDVKDMIGQVRRFIEDYLS